MHYISGMLRMRPKPPAGLPTINSGTPWSEIAVLVLRTPGAVADGAMVPRAI